MASGRDNFVRSASYTSSLFRNPPSRIFRGVRRLAVLGLVAVLAFAGCGKSSNSSEGLVGQAACGPNPPEITTTDLPSDFPNLDGVTYTTATKVGPSVVVSGFAKNTLAGLFTDLKEKFGATPYALTKSEKDAHDAEVNFSSNKDAVTGQVAVSQDCKGQLRVKITVRPK